MSVPEKTDNSLLQYANLLRIYPGYRKIETDIEEILLEHARPGMTLLDGGCGPGNDIIKSCLERVSLKVTGVDCNASALKKNATYHETRLGDLEKIPFEDCSFDIVTSFFVMEHLKDPRQVLVEFARVLKPGGISGSGNAQPVQSDHAGCALHAAFPARAVPSPVLRH